jgi:hypothetical protein
MAVNVVLKSVFDDKGIRDAQAEFAKVGKTIGAAMAVVGGVVAGAGIAFAKFGMDAVKGAEDAAIAQRRLDQVAESMGLFGSQAAAVSRRLGEFAEANELVVGVDADVIKSTQAKLLTFKNLAETADTVGGSMDRATMAALDLAATGFGSAETNAVQLGKALQDPIKGLTALGRAGVTFTAQEKENIKVLVESGNVLEAQNQILSAIEKQVGGTAEATSSAFTKIELATNQVKDAIGEALLPVFEDLTQELLNITPALADALAPAAAQLAAVFRDKVLPAVSDFTKWLASPEGTKRIAQFADAVVKAVEDFVKFIAQVVDNWEAIKNATVAIGTAAVVFGTLRTALQFATAAQLLFNAAVKANPYVLAATALATLISLAVAAGGALADFAGEQKAAREASTGLSGRLAELVAEQKRLKELVDNGVISYADYKKAIGPVNSELAILQGEMMRAAGAGRDLNKVSIGSLTGQLSAAAGEANRFRNILAGIPSATGVTGTVTTTTATGKSAAEIRAEQIEAAEKAFEKVQKLVRATQKKIVDAQEDYDKAVTRANADYLQNVLKLRTDYANALEGIVKTSQDRLRSAFQTAVGASLSDLFGKEGERSVEKLVENLRSRLIASRQLIQNSSQLASLGFTQTFIEQVVSAGVETGNELAAAILKSTPETQAQLKGLFTALEQTGETGMDGLAKTIFEQQGLATRELRDLYKKTGEDLDKALLDQQLRFQETLQAAAETLGEKLRDIKTDFEEDVADLKGAYGGLKPVIDSVTKSLDSMIGKADQAAKAASEAAIKAANSTRAAIADITGQPSTQTDLGIPASTGSEGLRGFGDPLEMRRLAAIQAAGEALGTFSQQFVNTVLGQRSFVNDGQRTVLSPGASEARVGELIAQGFKEEIAAGIGGDRMNLALALAEQIYGVDIGGISTPGAIGGNTFNISVNAGMGTDPISVGAQIVEAIKRYERSSGQVFAGV